MTGGISPGDACLAFPREASSSRFGWLRAAGGSRPRLAFPREASSSRCSATRLSRWDVPVSPSPGRRVHRGPSSTSANWAMISVSPSPGRRVHRGRRMSSSLPAWWSPSRLPQGGEFIEVGCPAPARRLRPVSPSPGRRVHRGRAVRSVVAIRVSSRLPQGGEFIEVSERDMGPLPLRRRLAFPREASSSRSDRQRRADVRPARLAFPREASSSRWLQVADLGGGARPVSPSPGRRVHRGRPPSAKRGPNRESRLPQGGEFIEVRRCSSGRPRGRRSRLPQGGEFIEVKATAATPSTRKTSRLPQGGEFIEVPPTDGPCSPAKSRLPQGGEFIEVVGFDPAEHSGCGLAFPREASSSRYGRHVGPPHPHAVSPSPGRRVHRGSSSPSSAGDASRLAFPREASSSRLGDDVGSADG